MIWEITEENNEPILKLVGSNLSKYGFKIGDVIKVHFDTNSIKITKSKNTEKLTAMQQRNPSIKKLWEEFNLEQI